MDSMTIIAVASIVIAGITTAFGTIGPALAEGRAVATALTSLAQQPDASATITRTLTGRSYPTPGLPSKMFGRDFEPLVEIIQDTVETTEASTEEA